MLGTFSDAFCSRLLSANDIVFLRYLKCTSSYVSVAKYHGIFQLADTVVLLRCRVIQGRLYCWFVVYGGGRALIRSPLKIGSVLCCTSAGTAYGWSRNSRISAPRASTSHSLSIRFYTRPPLHCFKAQTEKWTDFH